MKTLKPLTESDKIDIALTQVFDILIKSVPSEVWEAYKNNLYNEIPERTEAVVKELQSKNFDATMLPNKGIVLKINTFKTCFTLESVPSLSKEYNSNLKRTANTFYDTNSATDKTLKLYKNIGNLTVKPLDMALRFESEEGVLAEIQRTENNILAANNDINITPKLATSKAKPGLLKVFTDELKYWHEVLKIAEETDYKDLALQKECDNTPEIEAFTKTWNNSRARDVHSIYLNERKVFDWFKFYDIKPVNDIDTVLRMHYANELKEAYNGNINQLIQEKTDEADNTRNKTAKMRASGAYYTLIAGLKKTEEQIKFLAYNKSEIETLIQKHGHPA